MTMLDELITEMKKRCWPEPTMRSQCAEICYWYDPRWKQRSLMCQLANAGWIYVVADLMDPDRNEMRIVETVGQAARFLDAFRQRLRPGEIPCLDPVFVKLFGAPVPPRAGETGRPVCVPPMERKADCQNDGPAQQVPMIGQRTVPPYSEQDPMPPLPDDLPFGDHRDDDPEPPQSPMTDDEREAAIRADLHDMTDDGPDCSDVDDLIFLLRRLDEVRATLDPPKPEPNDWIAQLGHPYQPPI